MRSVGNYTHSVTSCKLRLSVEILKAFNRHFTGYSKIFKLSKTELRGKPKFELCYTVKNYDGNIAQC